MADKQLTVKVRLNTKQFESQLNNITKKINNINNTLNNVNSKGLNKSINRSVKGMSAFNNSIQSSNNALDTTLRRLRAIAATYIGIMGTRAIIDTSDTITSAQNKLNYVTANQMGANAYGANGAYSADVLKNTQKAMDKMYASAQKVRMSYTDMMTNVSKSLALAGSAFDNNTDKAIRFQEIMAEAYAVGGASAAEMSSSMYQLMQALGAGVLAGDELRSVREGAPLAYKAIEEFVQGVYNTEESLKELGSQGKVTSDMVVEAIMNAGNKLDTAFAQTAQTFAQTWEQIKNAAKKAFEPISNIMRDTLNKLVDNGFIDKVEQLFALISVAIQIALKKIGEGLDWVTKNWDKVSRFIISGLMAITALLITTAAVNAVCWAASNLPLLLFITLLYKLCTAIYDVVNGTMSASELIMKVTGVVVAFIALAIMRLALTFHSATMFVIGLVIMVIAWLMSSSQSVCDFLIQLCQIIGQAIIIVLGIVLAVFLATGAVILSVPMLIALTIIAAIALVVAIFLQYTQQIMGRIYQIGAIFHNVIAWMGNLGMALSNALCTIFDNIGIWWGNVCASMGEAFWNFVANTLSNFKGLEGAINSLLSLAGVKGGISISSMINGARQIASNYGGSKKEYKDVSGAWDRGWNGAGANPYINLDDAYANGAQVGENIQNKINGLGSGLSDLLNGAKDKLSGFGNLNNTLGKSGLENLADTLANKYNVTNPNMPDYKDPAYNVADGLTPAKAEDLLKDVSGINNNTGSMADAMKLTNEDLSYLRKLAETDWKKEYTTAEIKVEMNNNNTVNGETDLDGIVTKLSEKLYEEMSVLANGVYA